MSCTHTLSLRSNSTGTADVGSSIVIWDIAEPTPVAVASLPLLGGETKIVSNVLDPDTECSYWGSYPTKITKICNMGTSNLRSIGTVAAPGGFDFPYAPIVFQGRLFVASSNSAQVGYYNITAGTLPVYINVATSANGNGIYSGVFDGTQYAYYGTEDGTVLRLDINRTIPSFMGSVQMPSGSRRLYSVMYQQPQGFLYFGCWETPGRLVKVNALTMTYVTRVETNFTYTKSCFYDG